MNQCGHCLRRVELDATVENLVRVTILKTMTLHRYYRSTTFHLAAKAHVVHTGPGPINLLKIASIRLAQVSWCADDAVTEVFVYVPDNNIMPRQSSSTTCGIGSRVSACLTTPWLDYVAPDKVTTQDCGTLIKAKRKPSGLSKKKLPSAAMNGLHFTTVFSQAVRPQPSFLRANPCAH